MTSIRFGEDFEIDTGAYELRSAGLPIRLERIPMEILLLLIEHRGELVTREQIVDRIWGRGISLDTDNSINGAIRKIRVVLRDDREKPRFISTVTAKGYRFIAVVSAEEAAGPAAVPPPATDRPPSVAAPRKAPARRRWLVLLTAGVLVVAAAAAAYLRWTQPTAVRPQPAGRVMLAVLPMENLTGDPKQEYFSDGLTEELISRLGNLSPQHLAVIARTSVMSYKRSNPSLDEVGRELGVQYVLEGSVRRDAERLRIAAQLIRLSDQTHVWAQQYDREQTNILSVQAEIAQAIADQIDVTFGDKKLPPTVGKTTLSPQEVEAYDDYLKGRFFWNKRTEEGFREAIEAFEQAIANNPTEARAYAGLADAYALMATWDFAPKAEAVPKAREAALKALQLDEGLAAPHATLALINEFFDFEWGSAESQFLRAIELDPSYATAHQWYAECLAHLGRFDEAIAEIDRARQLDPLSLIIAVDRGEILTWAHHYDEAIAQLRFALSMDPTFQKAHTIVWAYVGKGRYDEALADLEEMRKSDDGPYLWASMAAVYGRAGRLTEARQALQKMEESNRSAKANPLLLCMAVRSAMGDLDEAFACMKRACEQNPTLLIALKASATDAVRNDPRYPDILRCVHLTP